MSHVNHSTLRHGTLLLAAVIVSAALLWNRSVPAAAAVAVPPAVTTLPVSGHGPQTAVLAGGCFWGMELVFAHVDGVLDVVSGYAGGSAATAHYRDVARGSTGHAESVRITFDPARVSYTTVLRVYFSVAHDPTQVNRQGPDAGPQYRSEIFAVNARQARLARVYISQLDRAGVFDAPIATEVSPLAHFYPAEAHHQNYAARHPHSPYIVIYDRPKLEALKSTFLQLYRERPARPATVAERG